MKKLILGIIMQLVVAFMFTTFTVAQEFVASVEASTVKWEGNKVVGGGHYGTVDIKSGSFMLSEGELIKAEVSMDMTSLVSNDLEGGMKDRLENHLKSDDFFGVEKYPESKFVLTSAKTAGEGKLEVEGQLTIKGNTNPQSFTVEFDKENNIMKGKMEIDRSFFDVRFGSGKFFDNLGDKAINDIFTLDFMLKLTQK